MYARTFPNKSERLVPFRVRCAFYLCAALLCAAGSSCAPAHAQDLAPNPTPPVNSASRDTKLKGAAAGVSPPGSSGRPADKGAASNAKPVTPKAQAATSNHSVPASNDTAAARNLSILLLVSLAAVAGYALGRLGPTLLTKLKSLDLHRRPKSDETDVPHNPEPVSTPSGTASIPMNVPRPQQSDWGARSEEYVSDVQKLCVQLNRNDNFQEAKNAIEKLQKKAVQQGDADVAGEIERYCKKFSGDLNKYSYSDGPRAKRQAIKQAAGIAMKSTLNNLRVSLEARAKQSHQPSATPQPLPNFKEAGGTASYFLAEPEASETTIATPYTDVVPGNQRSSNELEQIKAELEGTRKKLVEAEEDNSTYEANTALVILQMQEKHTAEKDAEMKRLEAERLQAVNAKEEEILQLQVDLEQAEKKSIALEAEVSPLKQEVNRISRFPEARDSLASSVPELPPGVQAFAQGLLRCAHGIEERRMYADKAAVAPLEEFVYSPPPAYGSLLEAYASSAVQDALRLALMQIAALQAWAHQELNAQGVRVINPAVGQPFDSRRHAAAEADWVWINDRSERHNCVAGVKRLGFEVNGSVISKAQIKRFVFAGMQSAAAEPQLQTPVWKEDEAADTRNTFTNTPTTPEPRTPTIDHAFQSPAWLPQDPRPFDDNSVTAKDFAPASLVTDSKDAWNAAQSIPPGDVQKNEERAASDTPAHTAIADPLTQSGELPLPAVTENETVDAEAELLAQATGAKLAALPPTATVG